MNRDTPLGKNLNYLRKSVLFQSMQLLSQNDKRKVVIVCILQTFLSFLDLLAVGIFGILGALAVSGLESQKPGSRVSSVVRMLQLENFEFQTQVSILGIAALLLLVIKTLLSIYFTKKTLYFLSLRSAYLSNSMVSKLLALPLLRLQVRSSQEIVYAATAGVTTLTLGVIGSMVLLVSDTSLLLVMSIALIVVDPALALMTVALFSLIAVLIYSLLHKRASVLGTRTTELAVEANELLLEVLSTYREQVVRNRRYFYFEAISANRKEISNISAETSFMPFIGKYVLESSVLIGSIAIAAFQFYTNEAYEAVATLSVFIAASMRIAPAVLRIQQGAILIRTNGATAQSTRQLLSELEGLPTVAPSSERAGEEKSHFSPKVSLEGVSFTYPGSTVKAVANLSFEITPGDLVAIVGPSGGGKSTLVDLILGIISTDQGSVLVSGHKPLDAISKWPGVIGYVPQDVLITNASIRQNVALGFSVSPDKDDLIWNALKIAHLDKFVETLPNGLDTRVGERGAKLSGGQRQRLGIARAMFTEPKLLILDEATSALDGQIEADISDSIKSLKGRVTVVMIAHRLSTVRSADSVIYLDHGICKAQGSFNEVRESVPDFDRQAQLMGL